MQQRTMLNDALEGRTAACRALELQGIPQSHQTPMHSARQWVCSARVGKAVCNSHLACELCCCEAWLAESAAILCLISVQIKADGARGFSITSLRTQKHFCCDSAESGFVQRSCLRMLVGAVELPDGYWNSQGICFLFRHADVVFRKPRRCPVAVKQPWGAAVLGLLPLWMHHAQLLCFC